MNIMDLLNRQMRGIYRNEVDPIFTEIVRLEEMLKASKIPYGKRVFNGGMALCYVNKENYEVGDVAQNYGTYGAEKNLLEAYRFGMEEEENDPVRGWLSAEEAFEYFKKAHNNELME